MENEEYLDIKEGLSVGTMKIANKYEIFTEEEIDAINNKIPELDERVGVIEDEIEGISNITNKIPELDERVGVIEDEIDEINSSLDDIENNKADKTTTNNIQQQVNNLVLGAVGDGNNAEIVQARGEYSVLNDRFLNNENSIESITQIIDVDTSDLEYVEGAFFDKTGTLINFNSTCYIKIENLDYFSVGYKGIYGTSLVGLCFLDSSENLIKTELSNISQTTVSDFVYYNIPNDCKYICISSFTNGNIYDFNLKQKVAKIDTTNIKNSIGYNKLEENVNNLQKKVSDSFKEIDSKVDVKIEYGQDGYYDNKGDLKAFTGIVNSKIENMNYSRVGYKGKYGASACGLVFVDDKNNVISYISSTSNITVNNFEYHEVPVNCKWILYSSYSNVPYEIELNKKFLVPLIDINNKFSYNNKFVGVEWVAFGDSLTQGTQTTKTYHEFLAEKLGITVKNNGVGGTGFINNGSAGTNSFTIRSCNISPTADIITIFGSFNDMNVWDRTKEQLWNAIDTTIKNILNVNPSIIIGMVTPTPWGYINRVTNNQERFELYVNTIIEYCKTHSIPVLDLYSESGLMPWDSVQKSLFYCENDEVHPNSRGHEERIAPKFEQFLLKLCK